MRNLLIICSAALLFSCGMSPEEKLIADHEQSIGDTKIDLKFDPIETKLIKKFTNLDSANIIESWYDSLILKEQNSLLRFSERYTNEAELINIKLITANGELEKFLKDQQLVFFDKADSLLKRHEAISADKMLGVNDFYKEKVADFKSNPDLVLYEIWSCRYKIFNPLLQTEQEITNQYLIDESRSMILRKL